MHKYAQGGNMFYTILDSVVMLLSNQEGSAPYFYDLGNTTAADIAVKVRVRDIHPL
jgi:hypothetical protein